MTQEEIKQRCLAIAKDIDRVCTEYGISYSLCGGSVIGAHLYKGFIPWDDDIDLMMTRENYDRFLKVYWKKRNPQYHLRHFLTDGVQNLPTLFARVEDTETSVTEEIAQSVRKSRVFVDVTVFDGVPGKLYHKLAFFYAGYVYTLLYRKNGMTPGTGWKRAVFEKLPAVSDDEALLKRYKALNRFLRKRRGKQDRYCAELLSAAYSKVLYESRIFDSYIRVPFEDCELMMVRDYKDYLQMRYGRTEFSMDVPEAERQERHLLLNE